jgi:hypothetical protein
MAGHVRCSCPDISNLSGDRRFVNGIIAGNLLELNDQSREALAGRPTHDVTSQSIAARLQLMAANLSQALDGLNADRKFGIPSDFKVELLCDPNGKLLYESADLPENLQDLLLRLAQ